ncbi:hypothetical protein ACLOJK_019716 [Asimina triloba]
MVKVVSTSNNGCNCEIMEGLRRWNGCCCTLSWELTTQLLILHCQQLFLVLVIVLILLVTGFWWQWWWVKKSRVLLATGEGRDKSNPQDVEEQWLLSSMWETIWVTSITVYHWVPPGKVLSGERTVKRLRLSKALTIPDNTTIYEACRRMAARRVDAVLLTDSNALLCGILTDKDIATRVVARELNLEDTPVSKVMTRNPVFVLSDTLAVEALQKMVQGKFRHLPVVENGEVIALLDIAKCLYDAIARMERAAEKGKAIAAAVEGVEKHWGTSISGVWSFSP